jgi:hypothetical protein
VAEGRFNYSSGIPTNVLRKSPVENMYVIGDCLSPFVVFEEI